jgi:hypothetical protein
MATRSTIALEFADGTIGQVYCHFDGYLNNNGRILQQHYSDPFQLRSLIDRGDMSQLGNTVDQCDFYSDEGDRARYFTDFQDYFEQGQLEEYNYILRQVNGKPAWLVNCHLSDDEFVTIDRAAELSSLGA